MPRAVLVVDDEPGIVSVLSRLLADEGWTVAGAHDGAEGLLMVGRAAPSVILVDYIMPIMDGAAFVRALRRDPAARQIPVVMMSGLPESMIARKVKSYAGFIHKPFVFEDLARVLAAAAGPEAAPAKSAGRGKPATRGQARAKSPARVERKTSAKRAPRPRRRA